MALHLLPEHAHGEFPERFHGENPHDSSVLRNRKRVALTRLETLKVISGISECCVRYSRRVRASTATRPHSPGKYLGSLIQLKNSSENI